MDLSQWFLYQHLREVNTILASDPSDQHDLIVFRLSCEYIVLFAGHIFGDLIRGFGVLG